MATVLTTIAPAENCVDRPAQRRGEEAPKDSPLFRFGLRQLFAFVAAICALLAAMVTLSGLKFLILLVAVAVVVMHVFATALGSCLQSRTEREQRRQTADDVSRSDLPMPFRSQLEGVQAVRSAPRSPWHSRGCTYLPWLPRLVVGAMLLGGL